MYPTLPQPVSYSEIGRNVWNVLMAGACIGQVRKNGYCCDAYDASGLLIREACKTRAHAALWLVRLSAAPASIPST